MIKMKFATTDDNYMKLRFTIQEKNEKIPHNSCDEAAVLNIEKISFQDVSKVDDATSPKFTINCNIQPNNKTSDVIIEMENKKRKKNGVSNKN